MKPTFKPGDRVRVLDRPATAQERKEKKFFDHFRNLRGTIQRVYGDGEVCLEVDLESLPESIRNRHKEAEREMKERWLSSLSEEARRRLTEEEKRFGLRYSIIVSSSDLVPLEPAPTLARPTSCSSSQLLEEEPKLKKEITSSRRMPRVRRLTEEDLERAEEEVLRQKRQQLKER